ncbi:hypothetical protein [Alicyclobacillus mengziensis]|uniref:Uncharacterized protein n=1 Tax=Alicyclobacillus mengziensis TaxID=2931921 RepID=A0A9X7W4B8_9BACL|nr:hypothetical protein [Alicyclobacillus mengziensis]QSO49358.1 hypothetical protein JZ786_10780 [Alicyclobacillus mengziensis]
MPSVGDIVRILDDLYEDGIELVAVRDEHGVVRAVTNSGLALVEFEIGRVVEMHPRCFETV